MSIAKSIAKSNPGPMIEVQVSSEQMQKIHDDVKAEMEDNFNFNKLVEYLQGNQYISIQEMFRNFGLYKKYEAIKGKTVGELSDHEKMLCACRWLMYDHLGD